MFRILAYLVAAGFIIGLMLTDLDNGQRWLLAGIIWALALATWARE